MGMGRWGRDVLLQVPRPAAAANWQLRHQGVAAKLLLSSLLKCRRPVIKLSSQPSFPALPFFGFSLLEETKRNTVAFISGLWFPHL